LPVLITAVLYFGYFYRLYGRENKSAIKQYSMGLSLDKRLKAGIIEMNIDERIRTGYVAAFILLLISYLLIFYTTRQLHLQTERVIHTNEVITQIEILISDVKDAEVGFRGYLDVKENKFLEPFYSSQYRVIESLKKLGVLLADNPAQIKRRDTLQALINEKFTNINNLTMAFRTYGYVVPDSLKQNTIKGKELMDTIRDLSMRMKTAENILLASRTGELNAFDNAISVINIVSLVLAFLLALYAIITFNRENKAKNIYRIELENKVADLVASNKELTELKRIEKFAATGRIARTIAHEVRNPLTNIGLAAEQLKEGGTQTEETILYFDMIKRNADRVNQLVTELLQSTKFTELQPSRESINDLLDEALLLAKDRIDLQGLKVERKYADSICDVAVDKERIKIAFLNVVVNAIEAMEPGKGVLELETMSEGKKCVVRIKDNGTGMDKDTVSKLFEPYFTSKQKGNGLGLTNTQNIILNHKGNIYVDSVPGKGTVFTIILDFAE
jgi:signal transduction histidine kinase